MDLYILTNVMLAAAFILIPTTIIIYIIKQKKQIHFGYLYQIFAVFFFLTSLIFIGNILNLWIKEYWFDITFRFICSLMGLGIFFIVLRILPGALALRSQKDMEAEIDRRQEAEKRLQVFNERLLDAEKTAKLGYGYCDVIRDRIELSDMAFTVLGLPVGSILSIEALMEQVHPADLKFVQESLRKNVQSGNFQEFYFRIVTPSMEVRHLLVKGENIKNHLQETIMVKIILQDVSELRRYMRRIELQNKKLKKIAWVQSHRMRSPVATIIGMAELLNENDAADPINQEIIKNIKKESEKLDSMILEVEHITRQKQHR